MHMADQFWRWWVCGSGGCPTGYREGASMDQAPRTLQATGTLSEGHLNSVPHGTVTYPLDNSETLKHTGWGVFVCVRSNQLRI